MFRLRVPLTYFVITAIGESGQEIPSGHYETFSYDLALLDAGIENNRERCFLLLLLKVVQPG